MSLLMFVIPVFYFFNLQPTCFELILIWYFIELTMSISMWKVKWCKLAPTVTASRTCNFACMNMHAKPFYMHAKPFYMHENQCMQVLNLMGPDKAYESLLNHMPYMWYMPAWSTCPLASCVPTSHYCLSVSQ